MKPDMKLKKAIWPSGQVYLNVCMFPNNMKFSYLTNLKLNTHMSCSPHICSIGLCMKT